MISLKAGGLGVQLQVANIVFIMDPWWNPSVELQAIDRVHRIGQTKPVTIYKLLMKVFSVKFHLFFIDFLKDSVEIPLVTLQEGKAYLCEGLKMSREELKHYK